MTPEWGVRHHFDNPPSPVVLRCPDHAHAADAVKRCNDCGTPCEVVTREHEHAPWVLA